MRFGNGECDICGQTHPIGQDCTVKEDRTFEKDGWSYTAAPPAEGDCRKLVTLDQDGMTWVGIRAFNHASGYWMNNNEREVARVLAWKDLDQPARGRWVRGILHVSL